jgi:spermidine synthase
MLEIAAIDTVMTSDGTEFVLARRDNEWMVRAGDMLLMSSRMHDSEEELAERALERVAEPRAVLVGGLGLGYTLRAALDVLPADARVVVAELVPRGRRVESRRARRAREAAARRSTGRGEGGRRG